MERNMLGLHLKNQKVDEEKMVMVIVAKKDFIMLSKNMDEKVLNIL
jgi:hypothetical protein